MRKCADGLTLEKANGAERFVVNSCESSDKFLSAHSRGHFSEYLMY